MNGPIARRLKDRFLDRLADDEFRYYFQMLLVCAVLGTVSLIMCIMNIFTHKKLLMIATLSFAVISYVNFVILRLMKRISHLSYGLFEGSVLVLFTYFLLTGGTAGFSPHWILLLPSCGMLLLGKRRGTVLSAVQFVIIAFLLWFPLGKELLTYEYTAEFCMRFPVVFIAFFAIGFCSEVTRAGTYDAMVSAQKELQTISETDALTLLPNRYWFNLVLNRDFNKKPVTENGVMLIIDIDDFKSVNDRYGHAIGDETLKRVSKTISLQLRRSDMLCRWGGEEFFVYIPKCEYAEAPHICERICAAVRRARIDKDDQGGFFVTVSIGAVPVPSGSVMEADVLFKEADKNLYMAKQHGKNCYVIGEPVSSKTE